MVHHLNIDLKFIINNLYDVLLPIFILIYFYILDFLPHIFL